MKLNWFDRLIMRWQFRWVARSLGKELFGKFVDGVRKDDAGRLWGPSLTYLMVSKMMQDARRVVFTKKDDGSIAFEVKVSEDAP